MEVRKLEEKNFDLKDFRENYLKLTQSELAELMGIRQDRVSRLEKNLEIITTLELRQLAKSIISPIKTF